MNKRKTRTESNPTNKLYSSTSSHGTGSRNSRAMARRHSHAFNSQQNTYRQNHTVFNGLAKATKQIRPLMTTDTSGLLAEDKFSQFQVGWIIKF